MSGNRWQTIKGVGASSLKILTKILTSPGMLFVIFLYFHDCFWVYWITAALWMSAEGGVNASVALRAVKKGSQLQTEAAEVLDGAIRSCHALTSSLAG